MGLRWKLSETDNSYADHIQSMVEKEHNNDTYQDNVDLQFLFLYYVVPTS